ncbi:phosphoribosylanthranilate isomerase [Nitrosomonas supralitoralis]|uniref:N-(5'-phosphoribosyl)anthranilate isomerase n=1 Tax=Nitrosomonas supralitoralis TaxID=2116706 RepID=A0A2P7NWP2_9PROT|nr:phosphoribosylanthranilate isomerase [Nitrosomonas supralitoralis]PSJ17878.1 phosphoribosylanthranilate isomerase [Nitrosomonas supralitoralis]
MSVRVKVCGITRCEDAAAAIQSGVDAVGFVFWPQSTRYIDPNLARHIASNIPPFICTVGVYVDPDIAWVEETARVAKLNLLQFHGDETPEFCNQFSQPYIKAIRVKQGTDLLQYAERYSTAKGLLLDTYVSSMPGGTGHAFDWDLIPKHLPLPLILSGGLNPTNVSMAIQRTQPWAVDVSSGVEISKGIKDEKKIFAFMQGVKQL